MTIPVFSPGTAFGELTINSLSAHTYAWRVGDDKDGIRPLVVPTAYRGLNDVVIPGTDGEYEVPYRIGKAVHSLPFLLTGDCDKTGTPYANVQEGFYTNLAEITAAWLTPPTPPATSLAASIDMPGALPTVSATVKVWLDKSLSWSPHVTFTKINISIAAGYFS